jgi:hypothetical protein
VSRHAASGRAQQKEIAMTSSDTTKDKALTFDELDRVAGGIIIVSGFHHHLTSAIDRVALNPQPLPPRVFLLGR